MAKVLKKSRARDAVTASAAYKARSRARIAQLAKAGRGEEALREVSGLFGIDVARGHQLRLTRVRGVSLV